MTNKFDIIKYWDENLVARHIHNELDLIIPYLQKDKKNINYIDIGANTGHYYNILSKYFNIDNAIMVEASISLCEYLNNKFKNYKNTYIYNYILSDSDQMVSFADLDFDSLDKLEIDSINLGLSRCDNNTLYNREQISGDNFFTSISNICNNNYDFIKIDTENRDYNIIKSITRYIKEFTTKPLIIFENNYHNDMTLAEAQNIIDTFTKSCGYHPINIEKLESSSVFVYPL